MRKLQIVCFFVFTISYSQNKQVLYDFASLPQTLMLNPGAEVDYNWHVGFPLLSQVSVQGGFTGFSTYDIFADNGIDINDKLRAAVTNYGKSEFISLNQQIEVLNVGFRLPNQDYISFGYYQEFDFLAKIPRDLVDLFYDGNTIIDRRYSIKKLATRAELLGVFHIGISKKVNSKLQIGARAKLYSSVFNVNSKLNKGSLYSEEGTNNSYNQHLENIQFMMQTSGIFFEPGTEFDGSYVKKKLLLGGDLGFGLDVGFTHHLKKQWEINGSLQDVGFVYHTKNIQSYKLKGNYMVEGFQLNFDPANPQEYWNDLKDEFNNSIVLDTLYKNYISFRPIKFNGAVKYSFGQKQDDCRFLIEPDPYLNKVGFQLFSTVGAVHSYMAATLFYERRISKNLQTKITYTADPFSFTNIGFGLSTQLGLFNLYVVADNLLSLNNIYNAKSASVQLGINFIGKHKK